MLLESEAGSQGGAHSTAVGRRQIASNGALLIYKKLQTGHTTSKINDIEDLENPKDKFPNEKDKKLVA